MKLKEINYFFYCKESVGIYKKLKNRVCYGYRILFATGDILEDYYET